MPNWKKVIVSGSDAALSNLNVTGAVTASYFVGDGSQLTGILTDPFPYTGSAAITGSLTVTGGTDVLNVVGSGSTANTTLFSVDGNNGRLFEISDDLSDSLFSVNTIAGLPVVEVFSDNRVIMGAFNQNDFVISGSRVGIGTDAPETKLHVYMGEANGAAPNVESALTLENNSNTYLTFLTPTTTESGLLFGDTDNDAGALTYNHSTNTLAIRTNGVSNRMIINSAGNVGIGTTSIDERLHVQGNIKFEQASGDIDVRYTSNGTNKYNMFYQQSTDGWGLYYNPDTAYRLFITGSGEVGIGTNNPRALLHVGPSSLVPGYTTDRTTLAISDVTDGAELILRGQSPRIWFDSTSGGKGEVYLDGADFTILSGDPRAGSAGSSRLFISSSGNVGIGTTAPTQTLEVDGNALVDNLYLGSTTTRLSTNGSGEVGIDYNSSATSTYGFSVYNGSTTRVFGVKRATGDVEMNGDLTVSGIVTAQEFHTEFVSASIIYQSGSTLFGDTSDDVHTRKGKMHFTNISTTDGTKVISFTEGTDDAFAFKAYLNGVGATGNKFGIGSGVVGWKSDIMTWRGDGNVGIGTANPGYELEVVGHVSASAFSGSFKGDGSGLSGVTAAINLGQVLGEGNDGGGQDIDNVGALEAVTLNATGTISGSVVNAATDMYVGDQIIHNGDTDTYLQFNDANTWRVVTGNGERLRVSNSGVVVNDPGTAGVDFRVEGDTDSNLIRTDATNNRVGIGTGSPDVKLHILNASEETIRLEGSNNTTAIHFFSGSNRTGILGHSNGTSIASAADAGDMVLRSESGKKVHIATGGANARLTVDAGGNVGIGTTSPSTKLHVLGNSANIRLTESDWKNGSGQQGGPYLEFALGGNTSEQSFVHARIRSVDRYTAGGAFHGALAFFTSNAGSLGERLRIEYNGNVGIGTTAPTQKLEVRDGNILVSGSNSKVALGTATGVPRIYSNANEDLLLATANQSGSVVYLQDTNGYVGIGTSSPTKKLTVAGAISASSGFYGDGSNLTGISTSDGLANILENSNSADSFSINMNTNDITGVGEIQATVFNGQSASLSYVTASAGLFIDTPVTLRDGSTSDLALNFSSSANTGFFISEYGAGSGKQVNIRVNGSNIGSFNAAGITSNSNVYTGTAGQFRNYAGVWKATTGTAGGDAQFILNGKTIMHLDETDERVGIGTTNPGYTLDVNASSIKPTADLLLGEAAYSTSTDYIGMKTTFQTGSTDYMIISGKSDGNTYVSAKDGAGVFIRGGGNRSSNQIFVPDDNYINIDTTALYVNGALDVDDGVAIGGDLTVSGIVTAKEFHTEFVSASIVYSSGSTKFGNTDDDLHSFTGSIGLQNSGQDTRLETDRISVASTATVILDIPVATYVGAVIDYTVYADDKPTGMRTGQVMAAFDETSEIVITDNSTVDIGDTSSVTFTATNNGTTARITLNTPDTAWSIRTFTRLL